MTTTTTRLNLTSDTWEEVLTEERNLVVQRESASSVAIHMGEVRPTADSPGILIGASDDLPDSFSASGIPEQAKVYLKSADKDGEARVSVMKF